MTTNSLRCLVLEKMDMDYNIFSDILRYSPHLTHLSLAKFDIVPPALSRSGNLPPFTSPSVRTLTASIQQVLHLGSLDLPESYPPLLAHFPNLIIWNIPLIEFLNADIKPTLAHALHHAVNTYSPLLTDLEFRWGTTGLVHSLLAGAFSGVRLRRIGFTNHRSKGKCGIDGMMPGILNHADSIVSVTLSAFIPNPDNDPTLPRSPHLDASNTMFAKLMRSCPRLQTLVIPHYTVSIEAFEHGEEWACKELETLCVNIRGLDSADSCLTKLKDLRNSDIWRTSDEVEVKGETVDDRIIQKLIGLRHLRSVWLGTKDVYLPTI
ncbi:hypothetical protein BGZ96_010386 [Linnemannia gamsii]|uniref:F-box domain-containing protein n=1 Tax=Linnemannia gamsii TaxID=64522 RepID=A0ABQ7JV45_9FUNG|nr:hypothetical protein BGZ96_010386 [Linnemannia gamsii]